MANSLRCLLNACHTHPVTVINRWIASAFVDQFETEYGYPLFEWEATEMDALEPRRFASTGDPIECTSLAKVYGTDGPCRLPLVKTNFGHVQSTAEALGLIETMFAVEYGGVPRNLNYTHLPNDFAQIDTKLFVPQAIIPWSTNSHHPQGLALSSCGMSGTDVHATLEEAPQTVAPDDAHIRAAIGQDDRAPVWVFSGRGSQWTGMGTDLLGAGRVFAATRRAGRATDRPAPRVLGDRGDGGGASHRYRPGPAVPVHHADRARRHDELLLGAGRRAHREFPGRGRGNCHRGDAVAGRRGAHPPLPLTPDVPHRRGRRYGGSTTT